jgi:hypothetical protein
VPCCRSIQRRSIQQTEAHNQLLEREAPDFALNRESSDLSSLATDPVGRLIPSCVRLRRASGEPISERAYTDHLIMDVFSSSLNIFASDFTASRARTSGAAESEFASTPRRPYQQGAGKGSQAALPDGYGDADGFGTPEARLQLGGRIAAVASEESPQSAEPGRPSSSVAAAAAGRSLTPKAIFLGSAVIVLVMTITGLLYRHGFFRSGLAEKSSVTARNAQRTR